MATYKKVALALPATKELQKQGKLILQKGQRSIFRAQRWKGQRSEVKAQSSVVRVYRSMVRGQRGQCLESSSSNVRGQES